MSESSTPLELITDGMKSMFGFESFVKTFRKISEGMIPFPLFVPIIPKSRVIQLLRGKKHSKEGTQETLEQISDSNAKLNKHSVPIPVPILNGQLMAKHNPNYQQMNGQMFYNLRPPAAEMMPEMSLLMNGGLEAGQSGLEEDVRPNDLNMDYEENEENNNYAERFESIAGNSDEYIHTSDDRKTPSAQDVIHNWQIIDDELKKIGQQLGKLGKYLNREKI